jgi:enterochelin esterase family protein
VPHEYHETEGMHMWTVWRRYLADFMPRLFRSRTPT